MRKVFILGVPDFKNKNDKLGKMWCCEIGENLQQTFEKWTFGAVNFLVWSILVQGSEF